MDSYWKKNKVLIAILLAIWALVSYGFAILLAKPLYGIKLGQIPLSFWWAQQGSMFVFVILIFTYAKLMDRFDREHGLYDDEEDKR